MKPSYYRPTIESIYLKGNLKLKPLEELEKVGKKFAMKRITLLYNQFFPHAKWGNGQFWLIILYISVFDPHFL